MSSPSCVSRDVWRLMTAACDETLDSQGVEKLEAHLLDNREACRLYLSCMELDADLELVLAAERAGEQAQQHLFGRSKQQTSCETAHATSNDKPATGIVLQTAQYVSQVFSNLTPLSLLVATLAVGMILTVLAVWTVPLRRQRLADNAALQPPAVAARLTAGLDAQWQPGAKSPSGGANLRVGDELRLQQGLIEIQFERGTKATIEGPARLCIDSDNTATLHHGRLVACVPSSASGFELNTPELRFRDLGTEFAVEVDAQHNASAVVFEGRVEVRRLAAVHGSPQGNADCTLSANQSITFAAARDQLAVDTIENDTLDTLKRMRGKRVAVALALAASNTKLPVPDGAIPVLYDAFEGGGLEEGDAGSIRGGFLTHKNPADPNNSTATEGIKRPVALLSTGKIGDVCAGNAIVSRTDFDPENATVVWVIAGACFADKAPSDVDRIRLFLSAANDSFQNSVLQDAFVIMLDEGGRKLRMPGRRGEVDSQWNGAGPLAITIAFGTEGYTLQLSCRKEPFVVKRKEWGEYFSHVRNHEGMCYIGASIQGDPGVPATAMAIDKIAVFHTLQPTQQKANSNKP